MSTISEPTSYDITSFKHYSNKIIVSELPDILQVLEDIAEEELKMKLDPLQSSYISYLQSENSFNLVLNERSGRKQFMPTSPSGTKFYRGEKIYHELCKPSLFRNLSSKNILIERLRTCVFELLLESHPIVKDFLNSGYDIEPIGLAQHYGLKTNLLDLSNNKWVAAFFACTTPNPIGEYELLDSSFENSMGILYSLEVEPEDYYKDILIIGAQPFERPTRQNAYAISLSEDDNFNDRKGLRVIPFKHNKDAESILFDMFYRSKKIFPEDTLVNVVNNINKMKEISSSAVSFCKKVYYSDINDDIWSQNIKETGFSIISETKINFDEVALQKQCNYWWNYGRDKLSKRTRTCLVQKFNISD